MIYYNNNFLLVGTSVHNFEFFVDASPFFDICVRVNIRELLSLKVVATYFHIFAFFVEIRRSFERYM